MTVEAGVALPLWLLYEDEIEGWKSAQAAHLAAWLGEHEFKAERHRVLLAPDARGSALLAIAGLGKRQGALSLWHVAGLPERLPPRRYRLAQSFTAAEATQLYLGFAYGAYRFGRYRPAKVERFATLEPPENADRAYVALAGEALAWARDWINTPANDMGPSKLAAAVRDIAERHQARYREWVGKELTRIHRESVGHLKALNPDLNAHVPGWGSHWTWGESIRYTIFHVAYHTGQIYTARHLLGEETPDN